MNPIQLLQRLVKDQLPGEELRTPSCVFMVRREGYQYVAATDGRVLVAIRYDGSDVPRPSDNNAPLVEAVQAALPKHFFNQESLYGWVNMKALRDLAGVPQFQPRAFKLATDNPATKFVKFEDAIIYRAVLARGLVGWRGDRARYGVLYPEDDDDSKLRHAGRVFAGPLGFAYIMPCLYEPEEGDEVLELPPNVLRFDE